MGGSGLRPQEVLDLRGEGVLQLAAGAHSSAAVTGDGRLMLWGKLLAHVSVRLVPLPLRHLPVLIFCNGGLMHCVMFGIVHADWPSS